MMRLNREMDEKKQQEPPLRKTCIRNKAEPDLTIVVGGEEFEEYSQSICSWSDYFDTALDSGMKETESKRFEFPDRDPREWEWIVAVMAPLSKQKITKDKIDVALSWFDELCSPLGLEECDRVIHSDVLAPLTFKHTSEAAAAILDSLMVGMQFDLFHSMQKCFDMLTWIFEACPEVLSRDTLKNIVKLIKDNEDCRKQLLGALQAKLPKSLSTEQQELLIQHEILHHIIAGEIGCLEAEQAKTNISKIVESINSASTICSVSNLKDNLRSNPAVGHFFE